MPINAVALDLEAGRNPAHWNCVLRACCLGILPLIAVGILMCISLTKMLREDKQRAVAKPPSERT